MPKKYLLFAVPVVMFAAALLLFAQTSSQFPELDKNGKPVLPRPMPHIVYSPADLGHSGVTLPAGAGNATPNTSIVRVGDATKMTLFVNCTQNVDLGINVYTADDQSQSNPTFILYNSYTIAQTITAGPQQVFLASELAPNATAGTVLTNVRLPQLAISFFEKNDTATAGACTDRLIVGY
jgi:hypothetical protein